MVINIDEIDREQFMVHEHIINGEVLYLVQPQHIGAKWKNSNLHFRSSLWNNNGELVSAGFGKFFNFLEQPDIYPVPKSVKDSTIVEKMDGSLLIVSKYKGEYIIRTRGTTDARKLDNGHEIEIFKNTILPKLTSDLISVFCFDETWDYSILFEWVSPIQKIVLSYGDNPDWYLVGMVSHVDYSLRLQKDLDNIATSLNLKRPVSYTFPSIESLIKDIELWKGKEGCVIYYNEDQNLRKIKSNWYLALHRMKEALSSLDKVIDVWYADGEPSYQDFEAKITAQFDFELWSQIRGEVSTICDASKEVFRILQGFNVFVEEILKPLPNRKEQAIKVIQSYGTTNRASFIFKLLDGKKLESEDRKKLLYQVLKK